MTRQANLPGHVVALPQIASTALGMEYLGGVKAAGGESTITTPAFGARDSIMVMVGITGTAAAGHAFLRFNNDSAANYWDRTFSTAGIGAGLVTFTNTQAASQTDIDLEGGSSTALQRFWLVQVSNRPLTSKTAFWQGCVGSATLTPTVALLGTAEWVNTTTSITQVTLGAVATTLNANTRLQVYGRNYP